MKIDTDEIIVIAKKAAKGASKIAAAAEVKTGEAIDKAKLGYRIMELKADASELKKRIGDLVCRAHRGQDIKQTDLDDLLFELDAKLDELESLRARRSAAKAVCPSCGKACAAVSKFCDRCGADLGK